MARFAKTICDRCGREHVDGTVDDIYIRPFVLSAGTRANETAYTTKHRDLCMGCRDATLTTLTLLMDEKTRGD